MALNARVCRCVDLGGERRLVPPSRQQPEHNRRNRISLWKPPRNKIHLVIVLINGWQIPEFRLNYCAKHAFKLSNLQVNVVIKAENLR